MQGRISRIANNDPAWETGNPVSLKMEEKYKEIPEQEEKAFLIFRM